jgi:DNA repair protein RadC
MAPSIRDSGPDARRAESTLCSQRTYRARCADQSRRYRLHKATWTVVREPGQPSPRLLSAPAAVAELARDLIRAQDDDKEHFWLVLLNAQNHYLLHTEVSVGSQSATIVHPREVFGPALREGAVHLVLIHNHPSGDPTPSREDLRLTRQLADAAQLLDLRIHDHLIIGNGTEQWVSLAEQGGLS